MDFDERTVPGTASEKRGMYSESVRRKRNSLNGYEKNIKNLLLLIKYVLFIQSTDQRVTTAIYTTRTSRMRRLAFKVARLSATEKHQRNEQIVTVLTIHVIDQILI